MGSSFLTVEPSGLRMVSTMPVAEKLRLADWMGTTEASAMVAALALTGVTAAAGVDAAAGALPAALQAERARLAVIRANNRMDIFFFMIGHLEDISLNL